MCYYIIKRTFDCQGDNIKMLIKEDLDIKEKLKILSDSAKYDAACTSSGSGRSNSGTGIGNTVSSGICHSFAADGRCISLLKILFTNECIFDCRYCMNRRSNDVLRTSFTPEEVCTLTMEFYRRNYYRRTFLKLGHYCVTHTYHAASVRDCSHAQAGIPF